MEVEAPEGREERQRHHRDAGGRAEADEEHECVVVEHAAHRERAAGDVREREEHRDDHDVVQHRRERGGKEVSTRVEYRGGERDDAVEEHLRHEQPQQRRRQFLLRSDVRAVHVEGVEVDDPRRGHHADDGDRGEREDRDGEDRARGVVVTGLEVFDEEWNQGGGEHTAEQELVDDVGRLVGVAVGAGECGRAERVRDGCDPHEAGDARERGADSDDGAGTDE